MRAGDRYKKLIYSVVYNMINNKEEVNDIVQEVFIKIYSAWINIIRNINFQPGRSGLQQIAVWIILEKRIDAISIEKPLVFPILTPGRGIYQNEKKKRINDELNRLPENIIYL